MEVDDLVTGSYIERSKDLSRYSDGSFLENEVTAGDLARNVLRRKTGGIQFLEMNNQI